MTQLTGAFAGRVVVVTGAAGDIGRRIIAHFAEAGATVVGADLAFKHPLDGGAEQAVLDVADDASWQALMDHVVAQHGGLDVLVNGAGIHQPNIPFEEVSLEVWRRHFAVNSDGVFLGCQHAIRRMRASGRRGAIVNLASGMAVKARATSAAYASSKAAVVMTSRSAALAGAPHGIRVNAVLPGPIESQMLLSNMLPGQSEAEFLAAFLPGSPLGRMATPDDIARSVLFLCSDAASAVTGVALPVDSGNLIAV
jgi:NAD(P)-dependent dehydrogenase (short-subunit alcohol dehydrogenase family)